MPKQLSIVEIMQFIMKNPGGFPAWPLTEIFDCVLFSLCSGEILVCVEDEIINGVMLFEVKDRTFHIKQLIVSSKNSIKKFIQYYKLRYPNFCITGERRGKVKSYNKQERTFNLLQKLT